MHAAIDQFLLQRVPHISPRIRWLLLQTIYTGPVRRQLLTQLPLQPGRTIWDLGCGFGATSLELANACQAAVIGFDLDSECLQIAQALQQAVPLDRGSTRFVAQDVTALPAGTGPVHAIFSRFLLQHLSHPEAVIGHWRTFLEPGGFLVIEDADDGWTVQYPQAPEAWTRLLQAFRALQQSRGGNREIGRRIAHYVLQQGFSLQRLQMIPWASVHQETWEDASVQFEFERVTNEQHALVDGGYLSSDQFAAGIHAFRESFPKRSFVSNATVHLVAQNPY